ncbi:hypothetical protein LTR56_011315 [Elasticomyces elasticus]|nr:hypothetical protein LTR56_011315 [Elasticomyces elasticus]KAK3668387.1 hypothetical protein LTR22_000679 [Elasticomyces elasticus]KAK4930923.1 hypothetical protein LTR49_002689 [Elasticomyces elasticus]KAK5758665.1 hypothetical protein LTS12_011211 [Elasticomyces elasticus]
MSTPGSDLTSEDVRKQGNELYKAGKFTEALTQYKHAAELAPSEAAPLSNLSAVYFELGRYDESYAAGTSALQLLADDNESARQKLYLRRAKSSIYVLKFRQAKQDVDRLGPSNDRTALEACIRVSESSRARVPDAKAAHKKIILELPRYKPKIQDALEYYVVGHDTPDSLYDEELRKSDRKKISLMFGGIGDARNFHLTLMVIAADKNSGEQGDKLFGNRKFHYTLARSLC